MRTVSARIILCSVASVLLSSCGGGSESNEPPYQAEPLVDTLAKKPEKCVPDKSCFSLGGTISGLAANGLSLSNGADVVSPVANATTFTFPTYLPKKANYLVSVTAQPPGQQCAVANGAGQMPGTAVTNVTITCVTPEPFVSTFAGSGAEGGADGTGTAATFYRPVAIAADSAGNMYVAEESGSKIRKMTPTAEVTTFAGSGTFGDADGTGLAASFSSPTGVAVDSSGNVYVADAWTSTIRKITPAAVVTTFAGSSGVNGYADGTGSAARFNSPTGVATDIAGNVYVADQGNRRVRKITPAGDVTTLAGGSACGSCDGTGSAAGFEQPVGVAVDSAGNVYVADATGNRIRKITPLAVVSTLAGNGSQGSADGVGTAATFLTPWGVAVDSAGNVYVADLGNNKIRKITPAAVVSTLAGTGLEGSSDGVGSAATFYQPSGLRVDSAGNVYVADHINNKIRKIIQPSQ